jgi:hypothetical protein
MPDLDPAAEFYPRVSTILREMGLSKSYPEGNPAVEWGRARGSAVHKAIALYEAGAVLGPLHPDVQGPFAAYCQFKDETGYKPEAWEKPVYHTGLRFRGTLDSRGIVEGTMAILDFKCSKQPDLDGAALQLGAYASAWASFFLPSMVTLPSRYVIQLGEESYRVHDVTVTEAVSIFEAATIVYWAQREGLPRRGKTR